MSKDTAYRSSDPAVVEAYEAWKATALDARIKRIALGDELGREVWVSGSGYNTYVTGFGRLDTDQDGDLVHDGRLIVSSKRGGHNGLVVPNLRRKAGKDFEKELSTLAVPSLDLPGLPGMHVYVDMERMVLGHAKVWIWDSVVYALWGTDDAPMGEQWETIPLSTYHLAHEQYEKDLERQETS